MPSLALGSILDGADSAEPVLLWTSKHGPNAAFSLIEA